MLKYKILILSLIISFSCTRDDSEINEETSEIAEKKPATSAADLFNPKNPHLWLETLQNNNKIAQLTKERDDSRSAANHAKSQMKIMSEELTLQRNKALSLETENSQLRTKNNKFNIGTDLAIKAGTIVLIGAAIYYIYRFNSRTEEEKDAEKAYQEALAADPSLSYTYGQIQDLNLHRAEVEIGLVKKPETPYVPKSISEEEAYQRTRAIGLEKARQMEVEVKEEIARRKAKREKDEREYFEKYEKLAAEKQAKLKADKEKQKNEGLFGSEAKKETPTSSKSSSSTSTQSPSKSQETTETTEEETEEAKKKKALSKANG